MRPSTHYVMVSTFLLLILVSLSAIVGAAPAPVSSAGLATLNTKTIFDAATLLATSDHGLHTRTNLSLSTVSGDPETGEWLNPEPNVHFWACRPRQDIRQMCTMAFVQKSTVSNCIFIAYDHNCKRLGDWSVQRSALTALENGEKYGANFVTSNLKWNILVWMSWNWEGFSWANSELKIFYGSYVSFPFYWKDWPEKWRASARIDSGLWKNTYYDFFRVPFNCGEEHMD